MANNHRVFLFETKAIPSTLAGQVVYWEAIQHKSPGCLSINSKQPGLYVLI